MLNSIFVIKFSTFEYFVALMVIFITYHVLNHYILMKIDIFRNIFVLRRSFEDLPLV